MPFSMVLTQHIEWPSRYQAATWAVLLIIVYSTLMACAPVQAQTFSIEPLDPVVVGGQAFQTYAKAVNSPSGSTRQVVGFARETLGGQGTSLPVCWSVDDPGLSNSQVLDFPADIFAGAVAVSVNSFGEIVGGGTFDNASGNGVGLYWEHESAAPLIIAGIVAETHCHLSQINDDGVIVGFSVNSTGQQALAWRVHDNGGISGPLVLPTRPRGAHSDAALGVGPTKSGITEIAGSSDGAAVLWKVRTTSSDDLIVDGSVEVLDSVGEATGSNFWGAVCGKDRSRAVIWEALAGKKRSKTTLNYNRTIFKDPGRPNQINDAGMVVGYGFLNGNHLAPRAVVWTSRSAAMRTLESLSGESPFLYLDTASAVNDVNEIIGTGWMGNNNGGYQSFIARPVNQSSLPATP